LYVARTPRHDGQTVAHGITLEIDQNIDFIIANAARDGVMVLSHDAESQLQLLALGSYQVNVAVQAAETLRREGVACSVVAIIEPGRFRIPRDNREADYIHDDAALAALIPAVTRRLFICHSRAEIMTGVLRRLDTGAASSRFLGYRNRGGTLDVAGMQFANGQSVEHLLAEARTLLQGLAR